MRKKTMEVLIKMGIPVDILGFHYIYDAMEIYKQDESYIRSKTCNLYEKIAEKYNVSPSSVERCIRHAFVKAINSDGLNVLSKYRVEGQKNTNKNLLACVYLVVCEYEKLNE